MLATFLLGCNSAKPVVQNTNTPATNGTPEKAQTAIAHTTENQNPPTAANVANGATTSTWK